MAIYNANSSSNYRQYAASSTYNVVDLSIALWVQPKASNPALGSFFSKGPGSANGDWNLGNNGGTSAFRAAIFTNNGLRTAIWGSTWTVDTWYHVGMSYSTTGNNLRLWVNGVNVTTTTNSGDGYTSGNDTIRCFLRNNGGTNFQAYLADMGFWNIELTTDEWVSLALGVEPMQIRPNKQLLIDRMVSPSYKDFKGLGSDTGTLTYQAHPPIYRRPMTVIGKSSPVATRIGFVETPAFWVVGPGRLLVTPWNQPTSIASTATSLLLSGIYSNELSGAVAFAGLNTPNNAFSAESPGAESTTGALSVVGDFSGETVGAESLSGTNQQYGGSTGESSGGLALSGNLSFPGIDVGGSAGALTLAQAIILAAALSEERAGPEILAALNQLSSGLSSDLVGAVTTLATLALAAANSGEQAGSLTILQVTALLLAGAYSDSKAGAMTLSSLATLVAGLTGEAAGANSLSSISTLTSGLSGEMPGPVSVSANLLALALAGGLSSELPGASTMSALLQLAATLSIEQGGAITVSTALQQLLLAGGLSSERAGANILAVANVFAGPYSSEIAGALSFLGLSSMSGGNSGEQSGIILPFGTLGLSGVQSIESGVGTTGLAALLSQSGGLTGEKMGALIAALRIALTSGLSAEFAGSLTVAQQALIAEVHRFIRGGVNARGSISGAVGGNGKPWVRGKPR